MSRGESLPVKLWRKLFFREQWFLEIEHDPAQSLAPDFTRTRALYPPRDRFWADPFVVTRNDRRFVFVEELPFATGKGHIAVIELNTGGDVVSVRKVLDRPYHLSYPFLFDWSENTWMIPETGQNDTVEIYRCARFPDQWVFEKDLLEGARIADTTLLERDGKWWMFGSMGARNAVHANLHLHVADSPLGPWRPHSRNPVKTGSRGSRMAGGLFMHGGTLIRPSQDCSNLYGEAVILHRVDVLTEHEYRESEVAVIRPGWRAGIRRVHTLNTAPGIRVVDALRWLPRWN